MDALIVLAVLALLAGPTLAIVALVAVRRLSATPSLPLLRELTTRVYQLERQVARLAAAESKTEPLSPEAKPLRLEIPSSAASPAPPPPAPTPQPAVSATPLEGIPLSQRASPAGAIDIENLIGGRWFYLIGIVALLIAISLGVKYAFDNRWIGPTGRVAIGILLGALMLPWSHWLLGRGYQYFSEGIAALGEATLFVSVWAGCQYYSLYSRDVGFGAMIAITAVMAAIAIGRDSQRISVISLLGGLLAPILASSGKDEQVVLFTYLLLLGAGTLVIAAKKEWRWLPLVAFIGTQIYFWGWYNEFFHRTSPVERTALFASAFFFLYAAVPLHKAMRRARFGNLDVLLLLA